MVTMFLMGKGKEITHTYSSNKRDKMIKEGWKWKATIFGWNATISYKED